MIKQSKQFVRVTIAHLLLYLFACIGLASCQTDAGEEADNTSMGKVEINFTLSISACGTRAESHQTTQAGTAKEDAVNTLQAFLCDKNGDYVGKFLLYPQESNNFRGCIAKTVVSGDKCISSDGKFIGRIMVLANCPEYNGTGDLAELTYEYVSHNPVNKDGYIPMWGVVAGDNIRFSTDADTDLGAVKLLRSMAKIELIPNKGFGDNQSSLQSATLNRYNTSGGCVPANYKNYTTTDAAQQDAYNIPSSVATSSTSLAFTKNTDGNYIVYLPEMEKNKNNTVTVSIKNAANQVQDYNLSLGDYNTDGDFSNSYYDIVRNHIYRYRLNIENNKLLLNEEVLPWGKVESEANWDGSNGLLLAWKGNETDATQGDAEAVFCVVNYPRYTDINHIQTEDKSASAAFSFTLKEPAGVVWQAYLTNTTDFKFNTGKKDNDSNKSCVSIGIAREDSYEIKVDAVHSWTDNTWKENRGDYGVYTDFFIVTKNESGAPNPITINPTVTTTGFTTYWKNSRRFAGGGYTKKVTVDGKEVTLEAGQWIRIWQCEAKLNTGYDDLAKAISAAQKQADQYWRSN